MGCKYAVLPEFRLKSQRVNCLTYEQNTKKPYKDNLCLLRALALHLHGNERLEEETSKLFNLFLINPDLSKVQGVCTDDYPSVEDLVATKLFTNDIDLIDDAMVEELARQSIKKYEKHDQLLRRQYPCTLQGFPLSMLRYIFPKDWKLGASLDHMQRTSEEYKSKECASTPRNVF